MKPRLIVFAAIAGVASVLVFSRSVQPPLTGLMPRTSAAAALEERKQGWIVASGRVEPVTKELVLGFETSGVIETLHVAEGDRIEKGQLLARLRNEVELAQLDEARANALAARMELEKLTNGARPEEKGEAQARERRALKVFEQARQEAARRQRLRSQDAISREDMERAQRDMDVAKQEYDAAWQQLKLVEDMYRREDVAKAGHQLAAAEAAVRVAESTLRRMDLRSPVAGTVLRVHGEPGEVFSLFAPSPVISVGDIAALNVRTEVDERDIGRVRVGQAAYVRADAYGKERFGGKITRVVLSLTPKTLRTGNPSEPVDRSVLEVLITLDAPGPLVSGLRVDAYIDASALPLPQ
ncbi:HlyD family secretion protein [Nitratidesulfovibrio liaohensis]|uniref:HlyD family secretion protein n=1 Tax=Nitratidesulfovibrio liaohensis TaxID=2604158 RepID=UPI00141EBD85|nr:efflux RND transporter periplasmic adaptor subunit [Nitratidesulfovibrio liaohensis]NHZ46529.1 HlyD family efflux transporter periplasmic adaptor subunit [Nitratidesulfovibrio liaohensis]